MSQEVRSFALIIDNVVEATFDVPPTATTAFVKEVTGLNDLPQGTKFNPETQSFYSNLEDKPKLENETSTS